MACSKCGAKKAKGQAQVVSNMQSSQPITQNFVQKIYIGPDQIVPSVISNMTYGMHSYGDEMLIAQADASAHPEWWQNVD